MGVYDSPASQAPRGSNTSEMRGFPLRAAYSALRAALITADSDTSEICCALVQYSFHGSVSIRASRFTTVSRVQRPGDRRRSFQSRGIDTAGPRTRREGADRRVGAIVSKVIDQDLALATCLRERRRIGAWISPCDRLAHRTRKLEAAGNRSSWLDRNDDVQPSAAGCLDPRFQPDCLEHAADDPRSLDDLVPRNIRSRIEVPHEPVWMLEVLGDRIPCVDFDDPHLCDRHDGLDRIGDEVLPDLGLLLDPHTTECIRPPGLRVLQKI